MIEFDVDGYYCERCNKWHWKDDPLFKVHYKEADDANINPVEV
jgi:hypothetical protein